MATRTPLALAALACSAVRGLEPVGARRLTSAADDVDAALVDDDLKRQWVVRAPRTAAAGARLEQETTLLDTLTSWLPFALPQVAGTAALPSGGRAVVHRQLPGTSLQAGRLAAEPPLAAGLGRAVAAVHDLPTRLVEEVGLPTYGTEEYRFRRLAEVDRFAITGKVPHRLLTRWEQAVEEVGAWRFAPVVVHGDLAAENVLVDGTEVTGLLEWSEARVADPADDFGWLAVGADEAALPAVLSAYADARREPPDPDLPRRARLIGELAVARWLMHGVNTDDAVIVDDAVHMLADLDQAVDGLPW
jgi:aminoglycoside phosphotransferase (APT) family kinase protein